MTKYSHSNKLTLENFSHPFEGDLSTDDRYVKLAELTPWDNLVAVYAKNLSTNSGRERMDIRLVIGALIVKHKLGLNDRETVMTISEKIYLQYFYGLQSFQIEKPLYPTLLVDTRRRMGADLFDL